MRPGWVGQILGGELVAWARCSETLEELGLQDSLRFQPLWPAAAAILRLWDRWV